MDHVTQHRQSSRVLGRLLLLAAAIFALAAGWASSAAQAAAFSGPTNFRVGKNPDSVAVGDFNGDTDPDLAVANNSNGKVSILLGGAGGRFARAAGSPIAVGANPYSVAVGEFNGDSDPDLAVANNSTGNVSILLGGAAGRFAPAPGSPVPAGDGSFSVAVADFNGDSDPDLAVANYDASNVSILLGSAAARFAAAPGGPLAGDCPISVVVGDFNGDSDPDLAVANERDKNLSVLLGGAGASFAPAAGSPFAVGSVPFSVAVGDFNGDSHPDLAVANYGSNNVSVLLGNGGGGFAPAAGSPFAAGRFPEAVAVGDFNGDADPDLAVGNFGSNDVSILLGGAGASFVPAAGSPFAAGKKPRSVAVGDFDGDAEPDLAVANYGSNNVSILVANRRRIKRGPWLKLSGSRTQRLRRRGTVIVRGSCVTRCALTASAKVSTGRKLFRTKTVTRALLAGKKAKLRLTFPKRALRAIRGALRHGRHLRAKIQAVARAPALGSVRVKRTVRLKI